MRSVSLVVKYIIGRSALVKYLEGDVNIESDFEGDSPGVKEETPSAVEEKEEQVRAVLVTGSLSAYVLSLIPYLVSGEMGIFSAGNPYSSIAARTRSCSPPSNHKASTLA